MSRWPADHTYSIRYSAKHTRVARVRGPAREHACWRCWENDVVRLADMWATIHTEDGTDPWADYVPLCNPCHKRYDFHVSVCSNGHLQTAANRRWQNDSSRIDGGRWRCYPCSLARARKATKKSKLKKRFP